MTTEPIRYIIIDDHPAIRDGVQFYISRHPGFELLCAFEDIRSALTEPVAAKVDIIVLDLNLKHTDALAHVPELKRRFPHAGIIAYTQYAGRQKELQQAGIRGYLLKTERDELIIAMKEVAEGRTYFKETFTPEVAPAVGNAVYADKLERFQQLTSRQRQVAALLYRHLSNKEIAAQLFTSEDTVKSHRKAIMQKLAPQSKEDFYNMLRRYFGGSC